tara:strand:+ start:584 stop:730 length:147 start_codon:yes stop_codon:yes gene_type:complete
VKGTTLLHLLSFTSKEFGAWEIYSEDWITRRIMTNLLMSKQVGVNGTR